jgi:hypothetical protein
MPIKRVIRSGFARSNSRRVEERVAADDTADGGLVDSTGCWKVGDGARIVESFDAASTPSFESAPSVESS